MQAGLLHCGAHLALPTSFPFWPIGKLGMPDSLICSIRKSSRMMVTHRPGPGRGHRRRNLHPPEPPLKFEGQSVVALHRQSLTSSPCIGGETSECDKNEGFGIAVEPGVSGPLPIAQWRLYRMG